MSEIQTEAAALAVVRRNGYALYYVPEALKSAVQEALAAEEGV